MGLKQLIQQKIILANPAASELVLPGEPLIYSIKYSIGNRTKSVQFFRNGKWQSLLKSCLPSYYKTNVPVVLFLRLYVSPPSYVKVSKAELRAENVPAVFSFEVCDYALSFLELMMHALINSYRQIVKLDVVKFYSDNPRTVIKFMNWSEYVNLQNNGPVYTQSERFGKDGKEDILQSKRKGNVSNKKTRAASPEGDASAVVQRPIAGDSALQDSSPIEHS